MRTKFVFPILMILLLVSCSSNNSKFVEDFLKTFNKGNFEAAADIYIKETEDLSDGKKIKLDKELSDRLIKALDKEFEEFDGEVSRKRAYLEKISKLYVLEIENDELTDLIKKGAKEVRKEVVEEEEKEKKKKDEEIKEIIDDRITFGKSIEEYNEHMKSFLNKDEDMITESYISSDDDNRKERTYSFTHSGNKVVMKYDTAKEGVYSFELSRDIPHDIEGGGEGALDDVGNFILSYILTLKMIGVPLGIGEYDNFDVEIDTLLLEAVLPDAAIDKYAFDGDFTYNLYVKNDKIVYEIFSDQNREIAEELNKQ